VDLEAPFQASLDLVSLKAGLRALVMERYQDHWDEDQIDLEVELEPNCKVTWSSPYVQDLELELPSLFFEQGFFVAWPPRSDYLIEWTWRAQHGNGELDEYFISSLLDQIPETGGSTRAEWEAFLAQFCWTINGEVANLPEPLDFIDD